jgi:hypothetical protein
MELKGSLPCLQKPATGPYPEPDSYSLQLLTLFPEDQFKYYPPSTPRSSKWSLLLKFSNQSIAIHFS